jgi:cell division protein FtsX
VTAAWILRRARHEARRRGAALGALAGAMAMAAALGAAAWLGGRVASALLPRLQQQVHVIAYLDDDLAVAARDRLLQAVRQLPGVERVRAVGPDEALDRLRAAAASLGGPTSLGPIEPGFLPRSVEIGIRPSADLAARTAALAARLRSVPGLAEVDDMSEGLGRLASWVQLGRRLGALVLTLAVMVAASGVALALVGWRTRRREAEVLRLLGESPLGITIVASLTGGAAALLGALAGLVVTTALFPRLLAAFERGVGLGTLGASPALGIRVLALALLAAAAVGALAGHLGARAPQQGGDA